jgi:hypothetical protein
MKGRQGWSGDESGRLPWASWAALRLSVMLSVCFDARALGSIQRSLFPQGVVPFLCPLLPCVEGRD